VSARQTFNDRIEQFFRERAGEWIPAIALESVGGRQAWRTRVSDVRRERGLTIENRTRTVRRPDGSRFTLSEYRFVPAGQMELTL
jgi:hypothetical protein